VRYFLGSQVDISGLVNESSCLESLRRLLHKSNEAEPYDQITPKNGKDEFTHLAEMFVDSEIKTVQKYGGRMIHEPNDGNDDDLSSINTSSQPNLLVQNDQDISAIDEPCIRLPGCFQHVCYLVTSFE
jgi:hypothetical protein